MIWFLLLLGFGSLWFSSAEAKCTLYFHPRAICFHFDYDKNCTPGQEASCSPVKITYNSWQCPVYLCDPEDLQPVAAATLKITNETVTKSRIVSSNVTDNTGHTSSTSVQTTTTVTNTSVVEIVEPFRVKRVDLKVNDSGIVGSVKEEAIKKVFSEDVSTKATIEVSAEVNTTEVTRELTTEAFTDELTPHVTTEVSTEAVIDEVTPEVATKAVIDEVTPELTTDEAVIEEVTLKLSTEVATEAVIEEVTLKLTTEVATEAVTVELTPEVELTTESSTKAVIEEGTSKVTTESTKVSTDVPQEISTDFFIEVSPSPKVLIENSPKNSTKHIAQVSVEIAEASTEVSPKVSTEDIAEVSSDVITRKTIQNSHEVDEVANITTEWTTDALSSESTSRAATTTGTTSTTSEAETTTTLAIAVAKIELPKPLGLTNRMQRSRFENFICRDGRQCTVTYEFASVCTIYFGDDDHPLCEVPCNLEKCVKEVHYDLSDCPVWFCTFPDNATTTTTSSTTARTTTARPSPPSPISPGGYGTSVAFNVIFGAFILLCCGLKIFRKKVPLAPIIRNRPRNSFENPNFGMPDPEENDPLLARLATRTRPLTGDDFTMTNLGASARLVSPTDPATFETNLLLPPVPTASGSSSATGSVTIDLGGVGGNPATDPLRYTLDGRLVPEQNVPLASGFARWFKKKKKVSFDDDITDSDL